MHKLVHFIFTNNLDYSNDHECRKNPSFFLKKIALFTFSWKLVHIFFLRNQTKCHFKKEGSINSFLSSISLKDKNQPKTASFPDKSPFDVAKITINVSNVITSPVTVSYALKCKQILQMFLYVHLIVNVRLLLALTDCVNYKKPRVNLLTFYYL